MPKYVYICTIYDYSAGRDFEYTSDPLAIFYSENDAKQWVKDNDTGDQWVYPQYHEYEVK